MCQTCQGLFTPGTTPGTARAVWGLGATGGGGIASDMVRGWGFIFSKSSILPCFLAPGSPGSPLCIVTEWSPCQAPRLPNRYPIGYTLKVNCIYKLIRVPEGYTFKLFVF